jgi:single-strand DNA-binding protein
VAGSVNKVILVGNLGKDPEIRTMQSGDKVANFSIATSESWKDKASGERKEKTQWHNVVVWNQGLVGIVERFIKKGSKVYLEGQLETRKYTDNNGVDKYTTEVVLRPFRGELTMLDSKGGGGEGSFRDSGPSYESGPAPANNSAPVDALEDEIPF